MASVQGIHVVEWADQNKPLPVNAGDYLTAQFSEPYQVLGAIFFASQEGFSEFDPMKTVYAVLVKLWNRATEVERRLDDVESLERIIAQQAARIRELESPNNVV